MPATTDHNDEIDGMPVFWRSASAPVHPTGAARSTNGQSSHGAARGTPLYLHGAPTNSDVWVPFLERSGGLAPDLPGFGRSGKRKHFDYSVDGYARFIERYLDLVGVERVSLIMHDWGSVGLAFAQRHPERVERLVVIDAVPLLGGYRWHRIARVWRTPVLGELAMGSTTRRTLRFASQQANVTPGPLPEAWLDSVLDHFDHGTQRAILRLYRGAGSDVLAAAGAQLSTLSMPALVVWGEQDPYMPVRFAAEYARALGNAELVELGDAGHVPWLDRPDVIDRVVEFVGGE